jgi:hypothetical protein
MLDQKYTAFPHMQHGHMEIMLMCLSICSSCAKMCIEEGNKETANLCTDCADVCALAIKLHSRDSEFNQSVMDLCAQVCARCSEECAKMKAEHCRQCSEICKKCALACKKG